jgi:hypothetical protein
MSYDYSYGREEMVFVKPESVFGTLLHPAGTDAIKVLKADFGFTQERVDLPEKGSSRSIIKRVTRRKKVDWSIEKYLLPSGTAGTKPDDSDLWKALFGSETTPSSTVLYQLLAEPALSLSLFHDFGPHREAICGAVPTKWGLKWGGGDEPKVTFGGEAKDHYLCGSDVLAAEVTSSASIVVTDARRFAVGMLVKVGTETNGGAGFLIDTITYATNTIVLHSAVTHQLATAAVIPLPYTPTTTGSVIPIIVGTVKFGSTTIYITGGSFDVDQKIKMRNDEFGSAVARGYRQPEFRDVRCSLDLYFESGAAAWLNAAKLFTPQDIEVVLGDTSGYKVRIDANQVEFDIPKAAVPESDETTITLAGKCLGSTGEDELTVTFL